MQQIMFFILREFVVNVFKDVAPTALARDILAQEYGVDSDTIKKRIPRGISKDLNDKYPNIPNYPQFIKTMITEGLERKIKAQEKRKSRQDQQRLIP